MNVKNSFQNYKKMFLRFWHSDDSKISVIRDIFVAFLIVFIILLALWTYTGQWFGAPMVAIESGSMMHLDEPFGRLGTIDAGDMVLLVKVDSKNDVVTYGSQDGNNRYYGKFGDVIIYKPDGNENRDQIIHRAMCWVEVNYYGSEKTYTIEECGVINQSADQPLYCPDFGIFSASNNPINVDWSHSGFITKGDNPQSNPTCDQIGGITNEPVKPEWISGKARLELPWIGTINLLFNDIFSGKNTVSNVPEDSIICLVVLIAFLISVPIILDIVSYYKEKKQ